jgi:hypothetical protein
LVNFNVSKAKQEKRRRGMAIKARWRAWMAYFKELGLSTQSAHLAEAERLGRLDEFNQLVSQVRELTALQSY